MNNEPVAWISVLAMDKIGQKFTDVRISLTKTDVADIPLYTHPAKTLTDEEIEKVWIQALQDEPKVNAGKFPSLANQPFVFFARAILRKAQDE